MSLKDEGEGPTEPCLEGMSDTRFAIAVTKEGRRREKRTAQPVPSLEPREGEEQEKVPQTVYHSFGDQLTKQERQQALTRSGWSQAGDDVLGKIK